MVIRSIEDGSQFQRHVRRADRPVAVMFYADWCPNCQGFVPVFCSLADEFQGRMLFAKVNTRHLRDLEIGRKITGIPTVVLFLDGQEVQCWENVPDAASYKSAFEGLTSAGCR